MNSYIVALCFSFNAGGLLFKTSKKHNKLLEINYIKKNSLKTTSCKTGLLHKLWLCFFRSVLNPTYMNVCMPFL